jgi:DNA-binding MarR family transcriptional regulator
MAGLDLLPASSWLLLRIAKHGFTDPVELARTTTVPREVIEQAAVEVEEKQLARREGNPLVLTERGHEVVALLTEARRKVLADLLGDWDADRHADLAALLNKLAGELCGGDSDRPSGRPPSARYRPGEAVT